MTNLPKYSGPNRTGICICGHKWDDHHLGMVMRQEYVDETNEFYIAQECEFYGNNEMGGLDKDGNDHCQYYRDSALLDEHN
jgi:hypothetical protein